MLCFGMSYGYSIELRTGARAYFDQSEKPQKNGLTLGCVSRL